MEILKRTLLGAIATLATMASPAFSADPVKIGMITTLSGGGSSLGRDIRDGFKLAVDMRGGIMQHKVPSRLLLFVLHKKFKVNITR